MQRPFWIALIVVFSADSVSNAQGPASLLDSLKPRSRIQSQPERPTLLSIGPLFRPDSILQPAASATSPKRYFRLVDDEESGIAYIGVGTHEEPEVSLEDIELPELPAPPTVDNVFSADALKSEPVPLDGAAKEAEKGSKKKETKQADSRSSFGWIAGTGNQLGMLEWVDRDLAVFDYSFDDRTSLRVEPGYAMRWLTGPTVTDLPPYLFSLLIDAGLGFHVTENWAFDMVITPSWNTDFANKSYQLFRLPWQAVNTFKLDDEWKLVLGVTDLDREDIHFLPVAGMIYRPLDGSKDFNLVFPRPKAAWRVSSDDDGSTWGYVAGELGGGSFSIQRPGAVQDIVTLRDYRLLFGVEHRSEKGHASRFEAGWVFGRAVEYASGIGNYCPSQTAIIRFSSDY